MKKLILLTAFITTLALFANAQPPYKGQRIEALKIAYITQVLKLTSEEAQKFWPVYNSYFDEIKKVREANKDDELVFEEAALNVRKKYKSEFKKVLVDDIRVNKVFKVDAEFREELKKELKRRLQQRQQQQKTATAAPPTKP